MPIETTVYTTLVGDDVPIEGLPAEIIKYGYRLNAPGSASFRLASDHETCTPEVIFPRKHEIVVTRNREIVWRGPVLTANETDSQTGRFVEFAALGLAWYPRTWHVDGATVGQQAATDQFTVVANLIDHHQNKAGGDHGIDTTQIGTSGVQREGLIFPVWEGKEIGDAIAQLAARDEGFDYDIVPATRELRLHYPRRGRRRPDVVFDARNIRHFGRTIDGTQQRSAVLGFGAGEGQDMVRRSRQSSSAVAEYLLSHGVLTDKEVSVASTLQEKVDRELETVADPEEILSITVGTTDPPLFSYEEGDEVRVEWDSAYRTVKSFQRLVGRDVTWTAGEEQAVLYLQEL